jgi:gamma-tubulin complex component 2
VRAPLNSRVGPNTSLPNAKGKAKAENLGHIPVDIQEAIILEDLLYVLMVKLLPFHADLL